MLVWSFVLLAFVQCVAGLVPWVKFRMYPGHVFVGSASLKESCPYNNSGNTVDMLDTSTLVTLNFGYTPIFIYIYIYTCI